MHSAWFDEVYRVFLKPFNVKADKLLAPDETEADAIASLLGNSAAKEDFQWPRYGTEGPAPLGIFSLVLPAGLSWQNGRRELYEMHTTADNDWVDYGGAAVDVAESARDHHNGVTLIPWWSTAGATGTQYITHKMTFPHAQTHVFPWCSPPSIPTACSNCCSMLHVTLTDECINNCFLKVPCCAKPEDATFGATSSAAWDVVKPGSHAFSSHSFASTFDGCCSPVATSDKLSIYVLKTDDCAAVASRRPHTYT